MNNFQFFAVLFSIAVLLSCNEKQAPEAQEKQTLKVKIYIVEEVTYVNTINCIGRIVSGEELKLSFKTGGVIDAIMVREGQSVKKGDILAKLDLSEINAMEKQATLGLDKAKRDFERVQNLYNDSVATLEQYQNARTALELAGANVKIARFNLEYSVINAPYDGKILKRLAGENEIIAPGYPVFLFGSDEKSPPELPCPTEVVQAGEGRQGRAGWIVKANVIDKQVVELNIGDKAEVLTDAYPDSFLAASIYEISPFADPYTGTFEVKLQIEPVKLKLVSGLIVKNKIKTRNGEIVKKLPYQALINANGKEAYVYKIENKKPIKQQVSIFKILDDYVLINNGISKGDTVITENVNYIKNGGPVEIVE